VTLLRKELRSLLPLFILILLVRGADLLYEPFTERLDEKAWAGTGSGLNPGSGSSAAIVLMVLSLMAAYSLFPREHDDGTIHFLHALPVSRTRIFLAKVTAALLVLVSGVAFGKLTGWLLQLPNESSFTGHQFRLQVAIGSGFLYAAFSAFVLAHGVALSFLRRFGLVLYAVLAWIVIALERDPRLVFLNPIRLCSFEYQGLSLVIPWRELGFQAGFALFALGVAWFLWTGPAERFGQAFNDFAKEAHGKVVLGCGTALVVFLAFALLIYASWPGSGGPPEERNVRYATFQDAVPAETVHYKFTYPANLRERAMVLVRGGDASYAAVRDAFGARDGAPIVADLTDTSGEHLGIAQWQKIRVCLADDEPEKLLRHVFHHETAHAFQFQESRETAHHEFQSTQFFLEGGAEFAAFETVPDEDMRASSRRLALAACRRHELKFDELCDASGFASHHDKNLVYPVGETWVAALAATYGKEAPGNVLRAMARPDAPRGLAPLDFWQDTLQAAGYDEERVVAAWQALLDETEASNPGFLDALPALTGGVSGAEGDDVVIRAGLDRAAPSDAVFYARTRPNERAGDDQTFPWRGQKEGRRAVVFRVKRSALTGRTFQFQLGVQYDALIRPYFEDWQSAPVPR
jgi:hypothetical protein